MRPRSAATTTDASAAVSTPGSATNGVPRRTSSPAARRCSSTVSISVITVSGVVPGGVRRSTITSHRSGTMLGAVPPRIIVAFSSAGPASGWAVAASGRATCSSSAVIARAIAVTAFTPRCAVAACAARPWAVSAARTTP